MCPGNLRGNPAPRGTPSSAAPWDGAPTACLFPGLPATVREVGVPISAKVTVNQVTTWWTRVPASLYPQAKTTLVLCQVHVGAGTAVPEAPLRQGQLERVDHGPARGLYHRYYVNGIAAASVSSVEARLANGSVVHGSVAYGSGFPYAVWWINYPQGVAATVVFRDAAGAQVSVLHEPASP